MIRLLLCFLVSSLLACRAPNEKSFVLSLSDITAITFNLSATKYSIFRQDADGKFHWDFKSLSDGEVRQDKVLALLNGLIQAKKTEVSITQLEDLLEFGIQHHKSALNLKFKNGISCPIWLGDYLAYTEKYFISICRLEQVHLIDKAVFDLINASTETYTEAQILVPIFDLQITDTRKVTFQTKAGENRQIVRLLDDDWLVDGQKADNVFVNDSLNSLFLVEAQPARSKVLAKGKDLPDLMIVIEFLGSDKPVSLKLWKVANSNLYVLQNSLDSKFYELKDAWLKKVFPSKEILLKISEE